MGYHRAGFDVIGVDVKHQPHYPFKFIQADALNMLDTLILGGTTNDGRIDYRIGWGYRLASFTAIHASPPCQGYSITKASNPHSHESPLLIPDVRERLEQTGLPWVIENVEGAKEAMRDPVVLCGSQFGRRGVRDGMPVYLRRHRLFEASFPIADAGPHSHEGRSFPVFGNGPAGKRIPDHLKGPGTADFARELMGMDWGNLEEVNQAIPPVYTEYIGGQLMTYLAARKQMLGLAA
jgi:DNA (cytosine-5)-methyltransferase 1